MRLVLVLALVACGKDSDRAAPAGAVVVATSTCITAAGNAITIAKRELKRAAPEMDASPTNVGRAAPPEAVRRVIELLPRISELTIARCTEDRWSADAIACMTSARKPADTERCQELLTAEQQQKMTDAMATVSR